MTANRIDRSISFFASARRPGAAEAQIRSDYFFDLSCDRKRSSCALTCGVNDGPKSSASKTCRISISQSSLCGLGQRLTHSIASSFDFTCHSQ